MLGLQQSCKNYCLNVEQLPARQSYGGTVLLEDHLNLPHLRYSVELKQEHPCGVLMVLFQCVNLCCVGRCYCIRLSLYLKGSNTDVKELQFK